VVIECLRQETAPADSARDFPVGDLRAIDWRVLTVITAHHGVLPLVYRRLQAVPGVPRPALERMRADLVGNALRNLHLARELTRLIGMLRAAGVEAIAFKGPTLAIQAWGDLRLRQFNDLDLLVRPGDAVRAGRVLIAAGYLPRTLNPDAPAAALAQSASDEFIRPGSDWMIDLHWALMPLYFACGPATDAVWARAERIAIEGGEVMTLGRDDLALFLAVHGAKHGWNALGWIADFGRVIGARADSDIPALIDAANRAGCGRMLMLGAALATNLIELRPAPALADAMRADRTVARLAAGIEQRMFASVGMRARLYSEWLVPLIAIEGAGPRARYATARALRPTIDDVDFAPLPAALYPLYYAIRPLRLAWQQGRRLFVDVPHPLKRLRSSPP
jgi:Uncharacterised nucleotidyltransferase